MFTFILALAIAVSCNNNSKLTLPFFQSALFTPEWINTQNADYSKIHQIAPFSFQNQLNQTITNDSLDGHIYIANFFFTQCPSICPSMMNNMLLLQEQYVNNNQILLVSHTVTPWIDSPEILKEYGQKLGVMDHKWHLLTATQEEIYTLARNSYFADEDVGKQNGTDDFLHTENFLLIDQKRRVRGIYNGTIDQDLIRLKEDLTILLDSE